jgi:hypothetical protein
MGAPVPGDLLDALATRRLAERYAVAVDRGDGALFADQFAADGVLEAPRGRFEGRDALAGVPPMMRGLYRRTWHGVLGQAVDFAGDAGDGETYAIARHFFDDRDGRPACYEMTIRYADRFVRRDGAWLIAHRRLLVDATHRFAVDGDRAGKEQS